MPYFKDTLDGRYPIYSHVPLNDPRFVEITEAEWNVLRQADSTEDHPYSPYILNKELMAAALNGIPGIDTLTLLQGTAPNPASSANTPIAGNQIATFAAQNIVVG